MADNNKSKPEVITLEQIKEKAKGTVIEIPDWDGTGTINVRVRAIDLTSAMLSAGNIPDMVTPEVAEMFEDKEGSFEVEQFQKDIAPKVNVKDSIAQFGPALEVVVKEALVEPSYEEIQKTYPLTLPQKLAIFKHVTGGIDKIKSFR